MRLIMTDYLMDNVHSTDLHRIKVLVSRLFHERICGFEEMRRTVLGSVLQAHHGQPERCEALISDALEQEYNEDEIFQKRIDQRRKRQDTNWSDKCTQLSSKRNSSTSDVHSTVFCEI